MQEVAGVLQSACGGGVSLQPAAHRGGQAVEEGADTRTYRKTPLTGTIQQYAPFLLTLLLLSIYLLYVGFIILNDQGPVDYETFMRIGARFDRGEEVYGENSYYPLPYVMIFGILAALPRPFSMALWLLAPVLAALWITGWRPWVLIYSPLFGHFLGGQTALFGLLGFWGYRRYPAADRFSGGIWLALTLLKPQLGVIPCAWAAWHWWQSYREERRLPRQLIAFVATTAAIYLPAFILQPDWVQRWLSNPRPLFERAMAGLIPRGLVLLRLDGWWFLAIWLVLALLSLYGVTRLFQKRISLDVLTLWYFFVSPLVHDYDLIQTIPLVEKAGERWAAVLLGLPALWVILFAYGNDAAWIAITIIAPGLLLVKSKGAIRSLDEIQGARTAP